MEYNVANTLENKTSQDVGLNQQPGQPNCSGASVGTNPMDIVTTDGAGHRTRAIGTGEMLNVIFSGATQVAGWSSAAPPTNALLGYAFWSVGNFKNAYAAANGAAWDTHARYLKVDGTDPLVSTFDPTVGGYILPLGVTGAAQCANSVVIGGSTYYYCPQGTIPTSTNKGITAVTLSSTQNGNYPIWSFLRLVCTTSCAGASNLASAAQNNLAFGANATSTNPPDFIPTALTSGSYVSYNSNAVRSHFLPPGIGVPCPLISNGVGAPGTEPTECGGDVGGVVYSQVGDSDYANNISPGGDTGNRR